MIEKFKEGMIVRLNAKYYSGYSVDEHMRSLAKECGDEVVVQRVDEIDGSAWFQANGHDWLLYVTEADAIDSEPTEADQLRAQLASAQARVDQLEFELQASRESSLSMVDTITTLQRERNDYRDFYDFVVSIDGVAELAESLQRDDLEGWAEFGVLVGRICEIQNKSIDTEEATDHTR